MTCSRLGALEVVAGRGAAARGAASAHLEMMDELQDFLQPAGKNLQPAGKSSAACR